MSWNCFGSHLHFTGDLLRECKGLHTTLVLLRPLQPRSGRTRPPSPPWNIALGIAPMEAKRRSPRPAEFFSLIVRYRLNPFLPLRAYFTWGLAIARNVLLLTERKGRKPPPNEGRPVKCETALALIAIKCSFRLRIVMPMTGAYFVLVN